MGTMQLAIGTVVGGKIIFEGDPLPEGAVVTILARETRETFEVPSELEAELDESIAAKQFPLTCCSTVCAAKPDRSAAG